jgi:hypothetical protein
MASSRKPVRGSSQERADEGTAIGAGELALLPQHEALIRGSAVSPEVGRECGYRSVTEKTVLRRYGLSGAQCRVPALLILILNVFAARTG